MQNFSLSSADYLPQPPTKKDYGIGVVGCGSIVRSAHLPAYRAWEYSIRGCCDVDENAAKRAAEEFSVPFYTSCLEALLDRDDIEILDLAVHGAIRRKVIEQIARHPKKPRAILSQKPLAMNWDDARAIVEICEEAKIVLAVNQQQRWSPSHRALKHVIESGVLGPVYSLVNFIRGNQDDPTSWYIKVENFTIVDHGIHFLDLSRYFLNRTPIRVKCTMTHVPNQHAISPMIYSLLCEYEDGADVMSTLHFNNIVPAPSTHCFMWAADGTEGSAILRDHHILEIALKGTQQSQIITLEKPAYPINFAAVMGELMNALTENRAPQTSGRDNLNSIRIAYAAVESSQSGEAIEL
jgi:predicted dehydrogenase